MLGEILKNFSDFSAVRRALFFINTVPKVVPNFIDHLANFAARGLKRRRSSGPEESQNFANGEAIANLASNLITLFPDLKKKEEELWQELHEFSIEQNEHALGAVLVSEIIHCRLCGNVLHVKCSRISEVLVYDHAKGTFIASKIPKVCCNRKCQLTQRYGYYTVGNDKFYDENWDSNEFLLSTSRTAFTLSLLQKFEYEILIAKMSFKEKVDIYNSVHGYVCKSAAVPGKEDSGNRSSRYVNMTV